MPMAVCLFRSLGFVTPENVTIINGLSALVRHLLRADAEIFPLLEILINHIFIVFQRYSVTF